MEGSATVGYLVAVAIVAVAWGTALWRVPRLAHSSVHLLWLLLLSASLFTFATFAWGRFSPTRRFWLVVALTASALAVLVSSLTSTK